jgi:peptidoglycan/LPS O-acetylase OafA/YrhL
MKKEEKVFFPNLDGLRTIAFLFVFSEHIVWSAVKLLPKENSIVEHLLYTVFANGGMGVSVFFVLSGFLITYLLLKEVQATGKVNVWAFYIRRTLRIWPLYYLVVLFVFYGIPFIVSWGGHVLQNPGRIFYYLTFLSNFDILHMGTLGQESFVQSGVTWSVAIEEQFYIVWPLLFFFLPVRYYQYIFYGVIVCSIAFRGIYHEQTVLLYFHTLSVCGDLAIGGLAAYYSIYSARFLNAFASLRRTQILFIYLIGTLYILFNGLFITHPYCSLYNRLLSSIFFAFIILEQNFSKNSFYKFRNIKLLTKWGKYTYGLYLLHPIAIFFVKAFTDFFDIPTVTFLSKIIVAAMVLVLTCIFSYFSYIFVEQHFLKLKNKFVYNAK